MEKFVAHYPLSKVRELVTAWKYRATKTSKDDAFRCFDMSHESQMAMVVLGLKASDLQKSMTAHNDNKLWQDVYKPLIGTMRAYVKVQIIEGMVIIISFKEDTSL